MAHVVLLGDSIFDNAAYVPGGIPVIDQLRTNLPADWSATLLAVDGHVVSDVEVQLERMPADATHLVISCGGNDALGYLPVLSEPAGTVADVFHRFADIRAEFGARYRRMLDLVNATGRFVAVCTIYDRVPDLAPAAHSALSMFNEQILREAVAADVAIVDLRLVCEERTDYSEISPIEPSEAGGAKIAYAVSRMLTAGSSSPEHTVIHT